jgi:hypothetical protein
MIGSGLLDTHAGTRVRKTITMEADNQASAHTVLQPDGLALNSPALNICCYFISNIVYNFYIHRLSINRPTKRGKEKSRSDGHCHYEKEMDDHYLACQ